MVASSICSPTLNFRTLDVKRWPNQWAEQSMAIHTPRGTKEWYKQQKNEFSMELVASWSLAERNICVTM